MEGWEGEVLQGSWLWWQAVLEGGGGRVKPLTWEGINKTGVDFLFKKEVGRFDGGLGCIFGLDLDLVIIIRKGPFGLNVSQGPILQFPKL